jgi:YD repeat-containing protein
MIGVAPPSLVPLSLVGSVADAPDRFAAVAADWIEDHYGRNYFTWQEHWHRAPYELLARVFSRGELIRLWHDSVLASRLDDHLQEHEELTWKVQHSLWRYGCTRDYPRFVACHNGLSRLAVDLPGFDVRITHTRSIDTAAWAAHGRDNPIYLDASFGVLLYYRGKHVMTIGFALSAYGILVAQVQLREKRCNRFLYKLPRPYLDFALDLLQRAFPGDDLYLVTGASTTAGIRAAYGRDGADRLSAETASRIEHFYDQSLQGYARTGETIRCSSDDGRVFARLVRNRSGRRKAA